MVERRIKPYSEQIAENERREAQRRATIRNQTFGLLIVAAAILVSVALPHNSKSDFSSGLVAPVNPRKPKSLNPGPLAL